MWSQCKTLTHSWQRSSSWWDFLSRKYQWRKITLEVQNFDLHSWQIGAPIVWSQCTGVCANHLWETLSQTYLLPRPHGELDHWNISISVRSLSTWFSSCSSSIPSTSTVVSTTFPSSTPTLTLLSLELAPQVPSRLFVHQFLVLTIFYICVNIIISCCSLLLKTW